MHTLVNIFRQFLDLFWVDDKEYTSTAKMREQIVKNDDVVLSQVGATIHRIFRSPVFSSLCIRTYQLQY